MKAKRKKWIQLDEAVEKIMRKKNCTREEAMDILAFAVEGGKVDARKVPVKHPDRPLSGPEASAMFQACSDLAYMPLGYFIANFGFTVEEVMKELQSGRLRSSVFNSSVLLSAKLGEIVPADSFSVTMKAIRDWMSHPETPRLMLTKMMLAMKNPDFGKADSRKFSIAISGKKANQ